MFTKSTICMILPSLLSVSSSNLTKREESTIIVTPPRDTRVVLKNDMEHPLVDGKDATFTFAVDPGDQSIAKKENQTFYSDIFEIGSGYTNQLYHLECFVEVNKSFTGTSVYSIYNDTKAPHVVNTSNNEAAKDKVTIGCPSAEGDCVTNDFGACPLMPVWQGEDGQVVVWGSNSL